MTPKNRYAEVCIRLDDARELLQVLLADYNAVVDDGLGPPGARRASDSRLSDAQLRALLAEHEGRLRGHMRVAGRELLERIFEQHLLDPADSPLYDPREAAP